jgi:SAM-dependent methyltransferase
MQLAPQPTPAELEQYYPKHYWFTPEDSASRPNGADLSPLCAARPPHFVQRALRESKKSGPVLDVGCGGGLFLRLLRDRGASVMGLDFSVDAARVAWTANHVPATVARSRRRHFAPKLRGDYDVSRAGASTRSALLSKSVQPICCGRTGG